MKNFPAAPAEKFGRQKIKIIKEKNFDKYHKGVYNTIPENIRNIFLSQNSKSPCCRKM